MRIELVTEALPPAFHWDPRDYFRGTEEFYTRTAECLADRAHTVTVRGHLDGLTHNGVVYRTGAPDPAADAVLLCNQRRPVSATKAVTWTNYVNGDVHAAGPVFVPSDFMRQRMPAGAGVVPHGVDAKWRSTAKKRDNIALFTSAPDRGLAFLSEMWERVRAATGLDLIACYGGYSENDMVELYQSARFWLHPGDGVELFCLAGYKAQAAGCVPIVVPNMALAETVTHPHAVLTTQAAFERDLIAAAKARDKPRVALALPTWADTAVLWEGIFHAL